MDVDRVRELEEKWGQTLEGGPRRYRLIGGLFDELADIMEETEASTMGELLDEEEAGRLPSHISVSLRGVLRVLEAIEHGPSLAPDRPPDLPRRMRGLFDRLDP